MGILYDIYQSMQEQNALSNKPNEHETESEETAGTFVTLTELLSQPIK